MRNQLSFFVLWTSCLLALSPLRGQLVINNAVNAADGVQNVLLGEGVTVSNITFAGVNQQVAEFTCVDCNLGIASGLIMGSGNVDIAPGPNTSGSSTGAPSSGAMGDPDLSLLTGSFALNGACVIEFDFVPTGDSVAFDYVFASEEYSEYLGYGDTFGFFLSGPGISGPFSNGAQNIALIPGSTMAVSVPNVNNGPNNTGPCNNCAYFVWNGTGFSAPYNSDDYYIEYDGFTTVLTASAQVQCGETYHIKLAIADMFDDSWDCAVFLAAGSFQSNQIEVAYTPPAISPDASSLYEGCDVAWVSFTRPAGQAGAAASYDVQISGTAIQNIDYTGIPDELTFAVGQTTISFPVIALEDGLAEGSESITVSVTGTGTCLTAEGVSYTFNVVDVLPITVVLPDQVINCGESVTLTPVISGGFGQYGVLWSTGVMAPSITVSPTNPTTYTYVVSDVCGVDDVSGTVDVAFPAYPPLLVDLGPDQEFSCLEDLTVVSNVSGGYGTYSYSWAVNGNTGVGSAPTLVYSTTDEGAAVLTVTDQCGVVAQDMMNFTFPPVPVLVDLGPDLQVNCLDMTTLSGTAAGGIGNYTYSWTLNGLEQTQSLTYTVQVDEESEVGFIVEDECGNTGSDYITLEIPPVPVFVELEDDFSVTCVDENVLVPVVSGGVGAYAYEWSTELAIEGVEPTLTFQTDVTETVTLMVSDACGNVGSDEITLIVPDVPVTADAGEDLTTSCTATNALTVLAAGGVGNYTYAWFVDGQLLGAAQDFDFVVIDDAVVTVYVEDQCGNATMDEVEITVPPVPVNADAGPDITTLCTESNELSVSADGGVGTFTYAWYVNDQLQAVTQTFDLQVEDDAVVMVYVEDQCGNIGTDELLLNVPPVPVFVDAGPDLVVTCLDVSALSAEVTGGVGAYSYAWNDGNGVVSVTQDADYVTPSDAVLTVSVEDECGNTASDALLISVPPVPIDLVMTADTSICIGDQVGLEAFASGGVGSLQYAWSPIGSAFAEVYVSPGQSTSYTVSVTDECGNSTQGTTLVGVEDVVPGFTVDYVGDWGIQLQNLSDNAVSSEWYFGDGSMSTEEDPYHEFTNMEPWQVTLVITGALGCQEQITDIFYPLADVYVPNCFTPDNDGINDVFLARGHDLVSFEMWIYSRWGDLIFHSTDIDQPWDGSWNGGEHYVNDASYTVVVKAEGIRGNFISKKLVVTMIR